MPLTLTFTKGVLLEVTEKQAIAKTTDPFLKHHGFLETSHDADRYFTIDTITIAI